MGITIVKAAEKAVKKEPVQVETAKAVALEEMDIETLADRYGSLEDQITALQHNPIFTQFDLVKKELMKRLEEVESDESVEITGHEWLLEIGVCKKKARSLKSDAIKSLVLMLGQETFEAIATVSIKDCEAYLTPQQLEKVIEADTGYTKARSIKAKYLL